MQRFWRVANRKALRPQSTHQAKIVMWHLMYRVPQPIYTTNLILDRQAPSFLDPGVVAFDYRERRHRLDGIDGGWLRSDRDASCPTRTRGAGRFRAHSLPHDPSMAAISCDCSGVARRCERGAD